MALGRELVDAEEQARLVGSGDVRVGPVADVAEVGHVRRRGHPVEPGAADAPVYGAGGVVVGHRDHRVQQRPFRRRQVAVVGLAHHLEREHGLDDAGRVEPVVDARAADPPAGLGDRERDGARARAHVVARLLQAPDRHQARLGRHGDGRGVRRMSRQRDERGEDGAPHADSACIASRSAGYRPA